jgi:O-antigen/teichoic acid export membrane protein
MSQPAKHSLVLIVAYIAIATLNYAFGVLLSWFFSPAEFGMLGVAQSLLHLVALVAGSGFAWTAARDAAQGPVTDETRRRFRSAWLMNVVLGVFLGLGLWSVYVAGLLSLGVNYRYVIPLLSLTVILLAARSVFNGLARGLYRFEAVGLNLVGEVLVKIVVGLGLVALGFGVAGVMLGFATGAAASLLHAWWVIRPAQMWRGEGWFDKRVIGATLPLFASLLGTALMMNLDVLGLRMLSPAGQGDELSGLYQAAVILARTPVYLAQAMTLVLFSYASGRESRITGGVEPPSNHLVAALRSWSRFLVPAIIVLVIAPGTALSLFFPDHYQAADGALRVAAVGGGLLALVNLISGVLHARGQRRRPAVAAIVATVAQILVLLWLVPRLQVIGAGLSLVAAGSVALVSLSSAYWSRLWWRRKVQMLRQPAMLARLLVPLLLLLIPLLLLPDGHRVLAIVKFTIAGSGYLIGLWMVERQRIDSECPVPNRFFQFVQVVIGG